MEKKAEINKFSINMTFSAYQIEKFSGASVKFVNLLVRTPGGAVVNSNKMVRNEEILDSL